MRRDPRESCHHCEADCPAGDLPPATAGGNEDKGCRSAKSSADAGAKLEEDAGKAPIPPAQDCDGLARYHRPHTPANECTGHDRQDRNQHRAKDRGH